MTLWVPILSPYFKSNQYVGSRGGRMKPER